MNRFLFVCVAVVSSLSGCASGRSTDQLYRGEYFYNFESAAFSADRESQPWCVDPEKLIDAELPDDGTAAGPWGTAHVVVRGVLSEEGRYCNLGVTKRFLDITEVLEISNRQRKKP
ncbi:MAG: hypothetical protein WBP11_07480 [Dokdonella sp.]